MYALHFIQIRIAALNAASTTTDESQDPLKSSKSRTKEAQVQTLYSLYFAVTCFYKNQDLFMFPFLQEAEAFALYHKALDLQKHDKFVESANAYHELLKTPLLKEV